MHVFMYSCIHDHICILYNNAFLSVITSTQNSFTVNRLQQALSSVLKNPHVEREICQKISEKHLLHLARQHDQDNLGVEMMYYVLETVESHVGVKNLVILRENASSLDNISSYGPFKQSEAATYYDYSLTGRINKVDGLFRFQVNLNNEPVYTWLLNLEVDGQDKLRELFQCSTKMWQAVDVNRAVTSNATTFTLRTNFANFDTEQFINTKKLINKLIGNTSKSGKHGAEIVDAETDDDDDDPEDLLDAKNPAKNEDAATDQNKDSHVLNSEQAVQLQLQIAIYALRNLAHSHVYFVIEMLRYVCGKGSLYEHLYNSGKFDDTQSTIADPLPSTSARAVNRHLLYDIHTFLGSFTINGFAGSIREDEQRQS